MQGGQAYRFVIVADEHPAVREHIEIAVLPLRPMHIGTKDAERFHLIPVSQERQLFPKDAHEVGEVGFRFHALLSDFLRGLRVCVKSLATPQFLDA
jgi:hypothetical protein